MHQEKTRFEAKLIAPCGMNCGVCCAYLAYSRGLSPQIVHHCSGCRARHKNCAFLKKRCPHGLADKIGYCYQCPDFPCLNLTKIDKRYREKYGMSMIENLKLLKAQGMKSLLAGQTKDWSCPKCGGVICVHNRVCFDCGSDKE